MCLREYRYSAPRRRPEGGHYGSNSGSCCPRRRDPPARSASHPTELGLCLIRSSTHRFHSDARRAASRNRCLARRAQAGLRRQQAYLPESAASVSDATALEQLVTRWSGIRREVRAINAKGALLVDTEPRIVCGEEVVLIASYESHRRHIVEQPGFRKAIEQVLSRAGPALSGGLSHPRRASIPQHSGHSPRVRATGRRAGEGGAPAEPCGKAPLSPGDQHRLKAARSIFDARDIS